MIDKTEERRKWKNVNTEHSRRMYGNLNNELRRETDRARAVWWEGHCRDLEELERSGRSDLVYAKIKEIHQEDRGSKKQGNVVSKGRTLPTDSEDVKERSREYIEELYGKDEKPTFIPLELGEEVDIDSIGPDLLPAKKGHTATGR